MIARTILATFAMGGLLMAVPAMARGELVGHWAFDVTDNAGSTEYNYSLGEKRAMAVRNYLSESGGIPLHAMNTISYGESRPVADNGTQEGRSMNRRVVVRVLE